MTVWRLVPGQEEGAHHGRPVQECGDQQEAEDVCGVLLGEGEDGGVAALAVQVGPRL